MFKPSDHLRVLAGPFALAQLRRQGLQAAQIRAIAGAAGGPKGLILGPLDQFIFGHWLKASSQSMALIGASIGCWRLAAACAPDPTQKLKAFSQAYIEQDYRIPEGQRRPSPSAVSASFADGLAQFFGGLRREILEHERYRLHVMTSRGHEALARAARARPLDLSLAFARAWLANAKSRQALGAYLERVVFSVSGTGLKHVQGQADDGTDAELFLKDYPARQVCLDGNNWLAAFQASCSIPMVLDPVWDLPGAPQGPYWDGGLTDYHLHLNYAALKPGLVLYPHFIDRLIPGWLDKLWSWRHRAGAALDNLVLLCPSKAWVATLPDGRLPDRHDFVRFAHDPVARMRRWRVVVEQAQSLARAFECFTLDPACIAVEPLFHETR
ncbi:MAG: phospholipase [Betaproteobacteria bacterium]|jgi:hypothetical protein|nr:phospholipase [Pseudomonadota bacterium]NBO04816.1 phospholipase [Betaproteobacteria bacterium]NBO96268.1 phospholipase [Betaproteobacteria bacterium]NBP35307.1 phospholipase [Betaproteobacteria bacterium]NBQ77819.1 phospholipase [Betaproteobacteria bacterium]